MRLLQRRTGHPGRGSAGGLQVMSVWTLRSSLASPAARWSFVCINLPSPLCLPPSLRYRISVHKCVCITPFLPNILPHEGRDPPIVRCPSESCPCIDVLLMCVYVLCRSLVDCMQAELSTSLPMFLEDRDDINEEEGSTAHVSTFLCLSWMLSHSSAPQTNSPPPLL